MGKKRSLNTFESVSWKITHGYGRGTGLSYKPWISGHEFASRGTYIRLLGRTVSRQYCFMSRLEADAFILYDCMPDVSDILEQYYLTLSETIEISDALRIAHPRSGSYFMPLQPTCLFKREVSGSQELSKHPAIWKITGHLKSLRSNAFISLAAASTGRSSRRKKSTALMSRT